LKIQFILSQKTEIAGLCLMRPMNKNISFRYGVGNLINDERVEGKNSEQLREDLKLFRATSGVRFPYFQKNEMSFNSYVAQVRPTVWQVCLSPDGRKIALMMSRKLFCYVLNDEYSASLPSAFGSCEQPTRLLFWTEDSRFIAAIDCFSGVFCLFSPFCKLLVMEQVSLGQQLLNVEINSECVRSQNKIHYVWFRSLESSSSQGYILECYFLFESSAVVHLTYTNLTTQVSHSKKVNASELITNRSVECALWLSQDGLLVIVSRDASESSAFSDRRKRAFYVALFSLVDETFTLLCESEFHRGYISSLLLNNDSNLSSNNWSGISTVFGINLFSGGQFLYFPIVSICSSPNNRLVKYYNFFIF
jgi:hypothetical protein